MTKIELLTHNLRVKYSPKGDVLGEIPKDIMTTEKVVYTRVGENTYNYQSSYSYLMAYMVKHSNNNLEWKHIILTDFKPRPINYLKARLWHILTHESTADSDAKPLKDSMILIEAFKR